MAKALLSEEGRHDDACIQCCHKLRYSELQTTQDCLNSGNSTLIEDKAAISGVKQREMALHGQSEAGDEEVGLKAD